MKILDKIWEPAKQVEYHGNIVEVPWNTEYLAVDSNGSMYAYEFKPKICSVCFDSGSEYFCYIAIVSLEGMDWKDSLVYVGDDKEKEND